MTEVLGNITCNMPFSDILCFRKNILKQFCFKVVFIYIPQQKGDDDNNSWEWFIDLTMLP